MPSLFKTVGWLRTPFVREFSWLSGANQISGLFSLLGLLVLAQVETVTVVGQVVFAQAVAGVVLLFLDLRFEDAIQRYFPQMAMRSQATAEAFFWRLVRWDVAFGLCLALMTTIALATGIIPETDSLVPPLVWVALLSSGLTTCVGSINAGFAVTGGLTLLGQLSLVAATANALFMGAGAVLGGGLGYLLGGLVGSLLQLALFLRFVRQRVKPSRHKIPPPPGMFKFLMSSSAASSVAVGSESGVLTVAGLTGSPTLVALLRVSQAPARLLMAAFSPIAVQAFPRLANMAVVRDQTGIAKLAERATRLTLIASGTLCLVALPLVHAVVETAFGPPYLAATLGVSLMLASGVLRSSIAWSKVLPLAVGRPGLRLVVVLVESAIMLAGAAILTYVVEDPGTATSWLAGLHLTLALLLFVFWLSIARSPRLIRAQGELDQDPPAENGCP